MWDPTKSYHEQLKQMEKLKKDQALHKANTVEKYGNVPLEVANIWKKFTTTLRKDSENYEQQLRSREEAKRWVMHY